jgi:hypothetical protein
MRVQHIPAAPNSPQTTVPAFRWRAHPELDVSAITRLVQGSLTEELRRPPFRNLPNPLAGQCYVASEAIFYLTGAKAGPWRPEHLKHEGTQHWFLRNQTTREVLDPTASQFRTPVPYDRGMPAGFLTGYERPSHRAAIVLGRVESALAQPSTTPAREAPGAVFG